MSKKDIVPLCKNCGAPLPGNGKPCSVCGTKNKKPFYKRVWFILLAIIVVLSVIRSVGGGNKREKIKWNEFELSQLLPAPKSKVGRIVSNSSKSLYVMIYKTSRSDFNAYCDQCKEAGFTIEAEKSERRYIAYNADGYKLDLLYTASGKELSIDLDAPLEMGPLSWPNNMLAQLLPRPSSNIGHISSESSDGFYLYVGNTSKTDYDAYVISCSHAGFSVDYTKGEKYYRADDAAGNHLSLSYQGNNVMSIELKKPTEASPEPKTEIDRAPAPENTPVLESTPSPTSTPEPVSTPAPTPTSATLVNGMRPEFKEAMDCYEAFYTEYCDFMKRYSNNPSDLKLLTEYMDMLSNAEDMNEKFDAWDGEEMNDAELKYYMEVQSRVTFMLLSVAS